MGMKIHKGEFGDTGKIGKDIKGQKVNFPSITQKGRMSDEKNQSGTNSPKTLRIEDKTPNL